MSTTSLDPVPTRTYIRQRGPEGSLGPVVLCATCAEKLWDDLDPHECYDCYDTTQPCNRCERGES